MATAALAQSLPDRAPPKSMAGLGARGEDAGLVAPQLPARLLALSSRCDRLVRLIADNQRHHERRALLTRELIRTRTKQLRAELRWEKQQRKGLAS